MSTDTKLKWCPMREFERCLEKEGAWWDGTGCAVKQLASIAGQLNEIDAAMGTLIRITSGAGGR